MLTYASLNDAQAEAYKYADIDWFRLIINHKYIYERLNETIRQILQENNFDVECIGHLMEPDEFKNKMFERVIRNGERFNLRWNFNDIISFTIVTPWSKTLHKISKFLEQYRQYLYTDVLRIKYKKIIDGKIIILQGITEFGTMYEIRLVPSLLYSWAKWMIKTNKDETQGMKVYQDLLKQQIEIDKGTNLVP